jgi:hypothetical protein
MQVAVEGPEGYLESLLENPSDDQLHRVDSDSFAADGKETIESRCSGIREGNNGGRKSGNDESDIRNSTTIHSSKLSMEINHDNRHNIDQNNDKSSISLRLSSRNKGGPAKDCLSEDAVWAKVIVAIVDDFHDISDIDSSEILIVE